MHPVNIKKKLFAVNMQWEKLSVSFLFCPFILWKIYIVGLIKIRYIMYCSGTNNHQTKLLFNEGEKIMKLKKTVLAILVSATIVLGLTACGAKEEEFETGTWDGMAFTNTWANLKFTFPEGSTIATADEIKQVVGAGADALVNDGVINEAQAKAADFTSAYDFLVTLSDGTTNIQLFYENTTVSTLGKGATAEEYQDALKNQLTSMTDYGYEYVGTEKVDIGGQTFSKLTLSVMNGALMQEYYTLAKGKYMVNIIASYLPESADSVTEIISGVTAAK